MTVAAIARTLTLPRPARPRWGTAGVVALVVAGAALGVAVTLTKARVSDHPGWDVALSATAGFGFLLAGLVARLRRPANRCGLLMVATGVALFAEDVQLAPEPWLHTLGLPLRAGSTAVLAHLLLAFPGGRLPGRAERVAVAAAYGWSLVLTPLTVPFTATETPNLALLAEVGPVDDVVGRLAIPLALAVVTLLLRRWALTRPQRRHVVTPVVAVNLAIGLATLGAALTWGDAAYRGFIVGYQVAACLLPAAFLWGVLRVRLGRTAVSRLLESLDGDAGPERLRDLLARALDDPRLELVVAGAPTADVGGSAGVSAGVRANVWAGRLPVAPAGRAVTAVRHHGRELGWLVHDPAVVEDQHVLRAVAAAAGIALENHRLQARLREQLAAVSRSRARLVAAEQRARTRIERDLHDGVQARLVAALISVRHADDRLPGSAPEAAAALARAGEALEIGLADLRRIAQGIRPAALTEAGLPAALRSLLGSVGVPATVHLDPPEGPTLGPDGEDTVYFAVAEAVTNAVRHGWPRRLEVEVTQPAGTGLAGTGHEGAVRVRVRDDGRGGARLRPGGGLEGLQDRVHALGGRVSLHSPPGAGTELLLVLDGRPGDQDGDGASGDEGAVRR